MPVTTSAVNLNDTESRLWLQTKTASGHYWDQVIGVSQGCMNKNFEQLFVLYPEMKQMYNSDDNAGTIDATLSGVQILIPGGDSSVSRSEVLFQISFESGYMADKNGTPLIEDLSGWVITSSVKIDKQKAVIKEDMDDALKKELLKDNAWIEKYDVAGDYSAERVFAKLSSIKWGSFDPENTYCGIVDGKKVDFGAWAAQPKNKNAYLKLTTWLLTWSYEQDQQGRNILGVSFNIPPPKDVIAPTYAPVFMMNQTYPYMSTPQNAPHGATGPDGAGACNAYVWTELVKLDNTKDSTEAMKRRPDDHTLVWSGNFCTLPKTPTGTGTQGTFVLGRNVWLETFLLPELQPLSKAFDICHGLPYGTQMDDGRISCCTPYRLGYDAKNPDFQNAIFGFRNINVDSDPEKQNVYRFHKVNQEGPVYKYNTDSNRSDVQASTHDDVKIDITWEQGTASLKVSGYATSKEDIIWNRGDEGAKSWDKLWAWLHDSYTIKFEFYLDLSTTPGKNGNGIIDINVRGGEDNTGVEVDYKRDQVHIEQDGHRDDFFNTLKSNFKEVVPTMIANLKRKLKGRVFVFPGNGVFDFSNIVIGKYGNLLAEVTYLPLEKDEKFYVPRAPKLQKRVAVDPPSRKPVMDMSVPKFLLQWDYPKEPIPAALQAHKLVIRASNTDPTLWCEFKQLIILFTSDSASGKKDAPLFSDGSWVAASVPTSGTGEKATAPATKDANLTAGTAAGEEPVIVDRPTESPQAGAQPQKGVFGKINDLLHGKHEAPQTATASGQTTHGPTTQPETPKLADQPQSNDEKPVTTSSTGTKGNVVLRQKVSGPHPAILKGPPAKMGPKWRVVIDTAGPDDILRLAPGDYVELELDGVLGPAGTYKMDITEDWNSDEKRYFKAPIEIKVGPATSSA